MTKTFITILLFFLSFKPIIAQTISQENRIVIFGESEINVAANKVGFEVSIESTDSSNMEVCYKKHDEKIKSLTKIIRSLGILDKNITYTLLSASYDENESGIKIHRCYQRVTFVTDSVLQITKIQEKLIKNNFENLKSNYITTYNDKHKEDLLIMAVSVAKEKANTYAIAAGRKLGKIVKIMETEESDPPLKNYRNTTRNISKDFKFDSNDLNSLSQTLTFATTIKVVFELE
jgi:uncharacterized protein YggE